ncbi:MAG TPA: TauD/TfdA family dioxygenase [Alphaproteobacteria bacterium]|nr:TauD/TfdA family dioxygenase [Alphaproteobacteria bacterium]
MKVTPLGKHLGARIDALDLAGGLDEAAFAALEHAFHRYGVVAISEQHFGEQALIDFSRRFGALELNVASSFHHPEFPYVNILSNKRKPDGTPLGSPDAGQGWHADMSYNATPARASILYALEVPMRDGAPLGDTLFAATAAAYDALDPALESRLETLEAVHHFSKFYDYMIRAKGSPRPPLSEAQKASKPPVRHPLVVRHPFTGQKHLYADPGYTVEIVGLPARASRELLDFLFEFQTRAEFQYRHKWRVGDVLMWDNIATIHMATGGYAAHEHRLMWRTQVLGDPARYAAANPVRDSVPS